MVNGVSETATGNSDRPGAFEVSDIPGKTVYVGQGTINQGKVYKQIGLDPGIATGMYLMEIRAGNDHVALQFIAKRP